MRVLSEFVDLVRQEKYLKESSHISASALIGIYLP